jgi:hypothetical protein
VRKMARTKGSKNKIVPQKSKIKCVGECGRELVEDSFYRTKSKFFPDGRINICKDCIKKMINYDDINTVYSVLQIINVPFFYDIWEKCLENVNPIGQYLRQANSGINSFKGATWRDSIFTEQGSSIESDYSDSKKRKHSINDMTIEQLEEKWGYGYSEEEMFFFEKKYRKLIDSYGEKTSLHTEALITYIRFRVKEEMATADGDSVNADKWAKLADKASERAKITVQQLSKSDISGGVDLMPQLFEAVEEKSGIISTLPILKEQPYDDADLIIWAIINYTQRLEDKPRVAYKDIWKFYDSMLEDFYKQKGYSEEQIKEEREKRDSGFRDLSKVYKEPLYEEGEI